MITGLTWYRREQWERWKEISLDRDEMCDSYEKWLEGAQKSIRQFTKDGIEVHKVEIDVEEFLRWASKENIAIDGYARSDFANLRFEEEQMWRRSTSDKPQPTQEEVKRLMREAKGMDLSEVWEPYLRRPKSAVCPVFRESDVGPQQFGSGVLLKVGEAHFFLTAAHVADERRTSILLVPAKDGFTNLFGLFLETKLPASGSRNDDKSDVCVVRLPIELVLRLHENLVFLDHEDCDLADTTTAGDAYTVVGYPARKSKTKRGEVSTDQFSLTGEGVTDFRFDQLGLEPRRHLLVQHRVKRALHFSTMLKTRSPHPEGMSGGGIFAWSKDLPRPLALAQPKLVALLTEYHEQKNVFVGTRLSSHLMAIHKSDPTLPIVPIRDEAS